MGRIIVRTEVTNPFDRDKSVRRGMLVDTGAGALILPMAWKERLGAFQHSEPVELQLANSASTLAAAAHPAFQRSGGSAAACSSVPPVRSCPEGRTSGCPCGNGPCLTIA